MKHVDKTIEGYFENRTSIKADIEPNSTNNLERTCEDWKKRVNNLKRIVKNPYEQKYTERHKIVDIVQDAETSRKDKAQSIQPLQNLKSGYQELKLEMFSRKTTIFRMISYGTIQYLPIREAYTQIFDPSEIFKRIVKTYLFRKEITEKILEKHNKDKVLYFDTAQLKIY
ncbi:41001_t:CDS:2 [Gigaspora margarita]|uniref:41001_t:CDS:1 n=1 Tax=Gigaspora margarita TaxID=4874 RepID=A0ABN7UR30_GIGMA|nr:41001_t:CDS:2 [Gigaspora margarita]